MMFWNVTCVNAQSGLQRGFFMFTLMNTVVCTYVCRDMVSNQNAPSTSSWSPMTGADNDLWLDRWTAADISSAMCSNGKCSIQHMFSVGILDECSTNARCGNVWCCKKWRPSRVTLDSVLRCWRKFCNIARLRPTHYANNSASSRRWNSEQKRIHCDDRLRFVVVTVIAVS